VETLSGISTEIWSELARAQDRLLVLDVDGTLAPFTIDRDQARIPERSLVALGRIAEESRTVVAILSGRPIDGLEPLLDGLPLTLVGEHGWEERSAQGQRILHELPVAAREALERAAHEALGNDWDERLERKRCALVLHLRDLAPREAETLAQDALRAWTGPAMREAGLRADRVEGGVELRATARHKGIATAELVAREPEGAFVACLGDDVTDEDAFEAIAGRGYAIRVGPSVRASHATARLDGPEAVTDFLEKWHIEAIEGDRF